MRITVFCGSEKGQLKEYSVMAAEIGRYIGESGHELIFGGSAAGLMGIVCDEAIKHGASVIGVEPDIEEIKKVKHSGIKKVYYTKTLSDRKEIMIDLADAFIVLPGGLGTLDELTEILELLKLGEINKPIVIVNTRKFYSLFFDFINNIASQGFLRKDFLGTYLLSDDLGEIKAYLKRQA